MTPSYRKSSIMPPGGAYLRGGGFNLAKMMVSVLLRELEYKVEKF